MRGERTFRDVVVDIATISAAVCAVLLAAQFLWDRHAREAPGRLTTVTEWESYGMEGHRFGPEEAVVTIVEWGDYQCPFCRRLAPQLRTVRDAHPDDVALVYRHWPLSRHDAARPAAEAALCAQEQGRLEPFHDALYEDEEWMANPTEGFVDLAEAVGIPHLQEFKACLENGPASADAIDRDIAAVTELGGTGTPTVMINELLLRGVPDSTKLLELVRERLAGS